MSGRKRAVFLGSGAFAVPALERLARHQDIDLVGVVSAPPRPVGRRQVETPTPVHAAASALGVPVLTPRRLRTPEALEDVLALRPDVAVLADYGQIVPRPILDLPLGALNLHPSLLPRHRGASPIPATILAGDRETGVTLMQMDEGLDTGPIVAVERVPLTGAETAPDLEARLQVVAADLLDGSLAPWLRGELRPQPQSEDGATLTRPLRREDARLDPDKAAAELGRQVRAYLGWPGTFVELETGRLIVTRATPLAASPVGAAGSVATGTAAAPGLIVAVGDSIALTTGDGILRLDEVQPAGGRTMDASAYRRGRPTVVGAKVVAGRPADPAPTPTTAGSPRPSSG